MYFSKGNLQYIGSASTPYWKFADNQWDVLGTTTGQNSTSQTVDRDLFGWGTSGYDHGAVCYQPWSTSQSNSDYYAYGQITNKLYDQDGRADWGYNAINNGGSQENSGWRTLTAGEWEYVFEYRSGASSKYGLGNVNGMNGIILLPDEWTLPPGLNFIWGYGTSWTTNNYTTEQWQQMEYNGAIFLPAAGYRNGMSVSNVEGRGYYWSASCSSSGGAYYAYFFNSSLNPQSSGYRYVGFSVRLVRVAQ